MVVNVTLPRVIGRRRASCCRYRSRIHRTRTALPVWRPSRWIP